MFLVKCTFISTSVFFSLLFYLQLNLNLSPLHVNTNAWDFSCWVVGSSTPVNWSSRTHSVKYDVMEKWYKKYKKLYAVQPTSYHIMASKLFDKISIYVIFWIYSFALFARGNWETDLYSKLVINEKKIKNYLVIHFYLFLFLFVVVVWTGISNKLVPIQIVHGFSSVESDRLSDHLKHNSHQHQHQHQTTLSRGPDHGTVSFAENRRTSANGLATADNIAAISDVSSSEQMIYFTNENVKGNFSFSHFMHFYTLHRQFDTDHQHAW